MRKDPCCCGVPECLLCFPLTAGSYVPTEMCEGCPYSPEENVGDDVCERHLDPSPTCRWCTELAELSLDI